MPPKKNNLAAAVAAVGVVDVAASADAQRVAVAAAAGGQKPFSEKFSSWASTFGTDFHLLRNFLLLQNF